MPLSSRNFSFLPRAVTARETPLTSANGGVPFPDLTDTLSTIAAALDVAASDHDSTPEINDIQTAVDALVSVMTGDIAVVFDPSKITTRDEAEAAATKIRSALLGRVHQ